MNLREQIERSSGAAEGTRSRSVPVLATRALGVLVLAGVGTVALGGNGARTTTEAFGTCLASGLVLLLLAAAVRTLRPRLFESSAESAFLGVVMLLVVIAAAVAVRFRLGGPELVPIAFASILVSALFDRGLSVLVAVLLGAFVCSQPAFREAGALPIVLASGMTGALVVRPTSQRDRSYIWMIAIASAVAVAVVLVGIAAGTSYGAIAATAARGAGASVVSVVAAMLLTGLAERVTGRETHLTLLEWGDLNRPLLQRLSLEAPGTYAHTIAIANLAEAASRAVGANALLARVGAYYHDIGKLAKPQYFVENQARGRNLHDKLKPNTSAAIIRGHVREGVELAESEGVPRSIRAFITEHHGTSTIAFFLEKARERDGAACNAGDFSYAGPVPQSAETAIVMLADGVEAAVRAIVEPTPERIREVIDQVVRQRLDQGQLRDVPLTLRQLTLVKEQFARVLGGMYHARLEYPTPAPGVQALAR